MVDELLPALDVFDKPMEERKYQFEQVQCHNMVESKVDEKLHTIVLKIEWRRKIPRRTWAGH